MDYSREPEAPVYYIDDINSDDERSDPELYTSSATGSSVDTLTSSEVHDFFQEVHGRKFPAEATVPVSTPVDSFGLQSHAGQHQILKAFLGSNYWGPVDQVLATAPGQEERKKVLDMATADGTWAQEMSLQFPNVDFLSLDNVPLTTHMPRPNVEFEVYDMYNGILAPDETFDVVHLRFVVVQLTNPRDVIRDIYRVLKPGGLFLFVDTESNIFDALNPGRVMSEVIPSYCEGINVVRDGLSRQGVDVDMSRKLAGWLAPDSDTWASVQPKEPSKPVGFRNIEYKQCLLPIGPWPEDPRLKMIGRANKQLSEHVWRNMEVPLRIFGQDEANAKRIVQGVLEDHNRPGVSTAAKFHMIYAFKI